MEDLLPEIQQIVQDMEPFFGEDGDSPKEFFLPDQLEDQISQFFSSTCPEGLTPNSLQKMRIVLMEALGKCLKNSKRLVLRLNRLGVDKDYRLSPSELEALLQPSRSSTVLECMNLSDKIMETEGSWLMVAHILRDSRTLHTIEASWTKMRAAGFAFLAEAVAASKPSPLQHLNLSNNPIGDEVGCRLIKEVLANAPNLHTLDLWNIGLDPAGAQLLGEAVAMHSSLTKLTLQLDVELDAEGELKTGYESVSEPPKWPMDLFLAAAFLEPNPNTSIRSVTFFSTNPSIPYGNPRLGVLNRVLSNPDSHIKSLDLITKNYVSCEDMGKLFASLQHNSSLQTLELSRMDIVAAVDEREVHPLPDSTFAFDQLVNLLTTTTTLNHITLGFRRDSGEIDVDWAAFYLALKSNSSIKNLDLRGSFVSQGSENEFFDWIHTTTVLQELSLSPYDLPFGYNRIFKALRDNTSLNKLTLEAKSVERDEDFRELMAALQINTTLKEIDLRGSSTGAMVKEALKSKARQTTYLAELRSGLADKPWTNPKCGRVFLCGAPMAGKTRLLRTMLKSRSSTEEPTCLARLMEKVHALARTEGIEIHTLRRDDDMQIDVWDLAGHDIFRALQEYLFPKLSKACIFVFVFSPIIREGRRLRRKPELEKAFKQEFVLWLRFITSNTELTGFNLPKVVVVLSHKDKVGDLEAGWARLVLDSLIAEFKDKIEIHNEPYYINGHELGHVEPIVEYVYTIFGDLFQDRLFKIPAACCQMSKMIAEWALTHKYQPIIDFGTFVNLCDKVPDLCRLRATMDESARLRVLRAVGSYLHDVGTIIELSSDSELMVVNPNWLTHVFLGRFIGVGHDFKPSSKRVQTSSHRHVALDGFLHVTEFQKLLRNQFLRPLQSYGFKCLDLDKLQALMKSLDLCYEVSGAGKRPRFYCPTIFHVHDEHRLQWEVDSESSSGHVGSGSDDDRYIYLGLRVRCKDQERTHLSTAFFCRFQVALYQSLQAKLQKGKRLIQCACRLFSLQIDGHEILMETDEHGTYVDVLVRSTKCRTRKSMWQVVDKHITEELREFCASAKGSPGVELVVDMLRTDCVKRLTPFVHRSKQAIDRDFLKEMVKKNINDGESDYVHLWKEVPEANLPRRWEAATEILPPVDIDDVSRWVRMRTEEMAKKVHRMQFVVNEIYRADTKPRRSYDTVDAEGETSEQCGDQAPGRGLKKILKGLAKDLGKLRKEVREVHVDVQKTLSEVLGLKEGMKQMNKLHKTLEEALMQVHEKLDDLIGISKAGTELPRRPFFCKTGVKILHHVTAMVEFGAPVVLHFLCEERTKPHIVEGQPGHEMTVVKPNRELLRQLARNTLKVLWILLKVGVQVATGLGSLVPELETPTGSYTSLGAVAFSTFLDEVPVQTQENSTVIANTASNEQAWHFLQDHLKERLQGQITDVFLLHRAQYLDSRSHAWLCKTCLERLIDENKAKKI